MRLTKNLIKTVITELINERATEIALYLQDKSDVSELDIAKDFKANIQEIRAILYRLYENNLVSFERKRDKHKGWHISHWDFLGQNVIKIYQKSQLSKISNIQTRIEREENNKFYICKFACARIEFDRAIEINFKCPECGELMNPQDNTRTIEVLNGKLKKLQELVH